MSTDGIRKSLRWSDNCCELSDRFFFIDIHLSVPDTKALTG